MGLIPGSGRSPGGGNDNHSSMLAWRIPWTEEPGGLQAMGSQESDMIERLSTHTWSKESHSLKNEEQNQNDIQNSEISLRSSLIMGYSWVRKVRMWTEVVVRWKEQCLQSECEVVRSTNSN